MMRSTIAGRRALMAGLMLAGTAALSGCATEDYVDKHIAAVNARIDQTDSRLGALEGRVNDVSQRADAAAAAAQAANSAAQAAGTTAQSAAADAQRANAAIDDMKPALAHLEMHHKYKTWRDVHPIHKKKMAAKRKSSMRSKKK
jgi:outer membrane murein-binding lipoprotein Lpp